MYNFHYFIAKDVYKPLIYLLWTLWFIDFSKCGHHSVNVIKHDSEIRKLYDSLVPVNISRRPVNTNSQIVFFAFPQITQIYEF